LQKNGVTPDMNTSMSATILSYTQFCSGIILLLFALIQLVYRSKSAINYVLSAIFFCIAFTILYLWLLRSGVILHCPALIYHDLTVTFAIGPLLLFYMRLILGTDTPSARIIILNFIPAAVSLVTVILINVFSSDAPAHAVSGSFIPDYSRNIVIWWGDKLSNAGMLIYFSLSIHAIRKYLRAKSVSANLELYFLFLYMFAVIGMAGAMFVSTIISSDALLSFSVTALAILGVLYIVVSFRYPGFTQKAIREARVMRIRKMIEDENGDDDAAVLREFETLLHESRIYTEEKLSLNDASCMLGVTPHQLSRIINDMTGMNFRNYLNTFRVREAQAQLIENPGMSVIEIAFATGFNSKSSFNSAFLKTTGVSPRDYRAKMKAADN